MIDYQAFTASGAKSTVSSRLPSEIFGLKVVNHDLLKTAYIGYLANGRANNALTLKRGEVRGGGKKPWRQKGTGRARFGSSRNPIWRGGGVAFGPTGIENYSVSLSVESRRQALRQALSLKGAGNSIIVIEKLGFKEPKTSDAAKLLSKIGASRNILVVVDSVDSGVSRAMNNLPKVLVVTVSRLSAYHVMNSDSLIITSGAIDELVDRLKPKKELKRTGNNNRLTKNSNRGDEK